MEINVKAADNLGGTDLGHFVTGHVHCCLPHATPRARVAVSGRLRPWAVLRTGRHRGQDLRLMYSSQLPPEFRKLSLVFSKVGWFLPWSTYGGGHTCAKIDRPIVL